MNMSLYGYGAFVEQASGSLLFRDHAVVPPEATAAPSKPVEPEDVQSWHVVHARIVELAVERAKHEHELCRWLVAADRLGVAAKAGFASLGEYATYHARLSTPRKAKERLRVGKALGELPALDAAFGAGELCWSNARELSRIVTPETEGAWVAWARGRSAKDVELAVARRRKGETPDIHLRRAGVSRACSGTTPRGSRSDRSQEMNKEQSDPSLETHRLSFRLRPETLAIFRDAQAKIRKELGPSIDDDTFVYELARRILGGPTDEGRASYQVAVTTCDRCAETTIDAGGESHPVEPAVAEMASCDAQHIGVVGPHVGPMVEDEDAEAAGEPHMGPMVEDSKAAGGETHVGPTRAAQSVPPATRRRVMRRDRGRCVVPGCRNHLFLDVHHIAPRAEGGTHDPDNLALLCGSHHRSVHLGTLTIDGTATTGFTVRHADGTPYGGVLRPHHVDLARQTLAALTHMGFKTKQARAAIDRVLARGAPGDLADFVRAALREA